MQLTCDICNGNLLMAPDGNSASCENCGMRYEKELLMSKMQSTSPDYSANQQQAAQKQEELNGIRQEIAAIKAKIPAEYKPAFERKGQYRAGRRWIATVIMCVLTLALLCFFYAYLFPLLFSDFDNNVKLAANIICGLLAVVVLIRLIITPITAKSINALGVSLQQLEVKEQEMVTALQSLGFSPQADTGNAAAPVPLKKKSIGKRILEGVCILLAVAIGAIGVNEYVSGDIRYHLLGDELVVYNYGQAPESFDEALQYIEESFLSEGKVIKWTQPIRLRIDGSPTDVDRETILQLAEEFNRIAGFPGIVFVESDENAIIYYTADRDEMNEFRTEKDLDYHFDSLCSTSWSREDNCFIWAQVTMQPHNRNIFDSQGKFNKALLHECYHMVGFEHTDRKGSIMASGSLSRSPIFGMDDIDILAFMMVYNPEIKSGITFAEFKAYYQTADIQDFVANWGE